MLHDIIVLRGRERERLLSLSHFNLFFGGFSSVMRWVFAKDGSFGSLKDDFFHTLKRNFIFTRGGPFVESSVCVCLCSCFFLSMNRSYNDTTNESLKRTLSRELLIAHSLSLSRSRSLVVTMLVLCSFCFFF